MEQLIRARRTIHRFEDRPVPLDLVRGWLDTAVWVPNHRMTQPYRFVVIHGEARKKLADVARKFGESKQTDEAKKREIGQKIYDNYCKVPLFVAVIMKENENLVVREEDFASTSCVIHNFSLLAWEQGVGLVWATYPLLKQPELRTLLGVEADERIVGNLHVGYPEHVPSAQPRWTTEQLLTILDE